MMKRMVLCNVLIALLIITGCSNLGKEKTAEEKAGDYVDALIQATVYQDAEKYADKDPSDETKEKKLETGELQRDAFKDIYAENTKGNMAGLGVSDEMINDLTDAFIEAIAKSEYEIGEIEVVDDEEAIVTVSVKGINNTKVYTDTETELFKKIEAGEITTDEEMVEENLTILTESYKNVEQMEDAIDVDVNVMIQEDGTHHVLLQDQYLAGFVR